MIIKTKTQTTAAKAEFEPLTEPTPWPGANARLLGVGAGLPVEPLDRLAWFSASQFERFTLEWAHGFLPKALPQVDQIQQRGGAGDKGRDIVVWLDPPSAKPRRWHLYQCKHYAARLGSADAAIEVGKVIYNTFRENYPAPLEYWFVTHKGVTGPLQDLLDDPNMLKTFILDNWEKYCSTEITSTQKIGLTEDLEIHIENFDFSIFRAKQPLEIINEHSQTRYHLAVFGSPLINRPPPPEPPSAVAPEERVYISQLFAVIAEALGVTVTALEDFSSNSDMSTLFDRSRITFYSAEGLKELARDQMADAAFFDTLLGDFFNGLYHTFSPTGQKGLHRLRETIKAAQSLQLGGHVLHPHTTPLDREGACHHLANVSKIEWCDK
ncbi:ABC-three component system protein [Bradyrhizobium barranii]